MRRKYKIAHIYASLLGGLVSKTVREYLDIGDHRREFELWYEKHYGTPYEWEYTQATR